MKLQLLSAITDKMKWHQARQSLLSENVANAETPGYRGRDLAAFSTGSAGRMAPAPVLQTVATSRAHIVAQASSGAGGFDARELNSFEITPEGNGVTLEDEMMKVASNQLEYQSITALYTRSVKLIKTALGRQA